MIYNRKSVPLTQTGKNKRVFSITVRLILSNCRGTVYFTDILLQPGTANMDWVGNVSEFRWTLNG